MSKDLPQLRTSQNKGAKIGIFLLFSSPKNTFSFYCLSSIFDFVMFCLSKFYVPASRYCHKKQIYFHYILFSIVPEG